jgi:hypothetical protein
MVNRTNNTLKRFNRRFNSIFLKTPSLIEFNELVKKESLCQEDIVNDIRSGRSHEKDHQEVWIPDIPLSYYEFKSDQEDGEDPFPGGHATTDPEDSSDSDAPHDQQEGREATFQHLEESSHRSRGEETGKESERCEAHHH